MYSKYSYDETHSGRNYLLETDTHFLGKRFKGQDLADDLREKRLHEGTLLNNDVSN